jgi:hypothetical protein
LARVWGPGVRVWRFAMADEADELLDAVTDRLFEAIKGCMDAMTPEQIAETVTLARLDFTSPPGAIFREVEGNAFEIVWGGRVIGVVDQHWLATGELPDEDWPPAGHADPSGGA